MVHEHTRVQLGQGQQGCHKVIKVAVNALSKASGVPSPAANPHIDQLLNSILVHHTHLSHTTQPPSHSGLLAGTAQQQQPQYRHLAIQGTHTIHPHQLPSHTAHLNHTHIGWMTAHHASSQSEALRTTKLSSAHQLHTNTPGS
jgi:hypothetical protein